MAKRQQNMDKDKDQVKTRAQEIIRLAAEFCSQHLDDEYAGLCEQLVRKMGRKRAVPFVAGRTTIWAGAVIYALGQINFLFDRSQVPHVAQADIASHFGTTTTTLGQKAKLIRDMFKMGYWDPEFSTARNRTNNPLANLLVIDGLVVPLDVVLKPGRRKG